MRLKIYFVSKKRTGNMLKKLKLYMEYIVSYLSKKVFKERKLIQNLGHNAQSAASKIQVKSALNPILWLIAIVLPVCLGTALLFDENPIIQYLLVGFGLSPILVAIIIFVYFALNKPEKLQSEDYQIKRQSLQIIQQQSDGKEISLETLRPILNPELSVNEVE